jgi:hypothetical protein
MYPRSPGISATVKIKLILQEPKLPINMAYMTLAVMFMNGAGIITANTTEKKCSIPKVLKKVFIALPEGAVLIVKLMLVPSLRAEVLLPILKATIWAFG